MPTETAHDLLQWYVQKISFDRFFGPSNVAERQPRIRIEAFAHARPQALFDVVPSAGVRLTEHFVRAADILDRIAMEVDPRATTSTRRLTRIKAAAAFRAPADVPWEDLNERRHNLIDKDMTVGLTPSELGELRELDEAADEYLERIDPEPFAYLERLERLAKEAGLMNDT